MLLTSKPRHVFVASSLLTKNSYSFKISSKHPSLGFFVASSSATKERIYNIETGTPGRWRGAVAKARCSSRGRCAHRRACGPPHRRQSHPNTPSTAALPLKKSNRYINVTKWPITSNRYSPSEPLLRFRSTAFKDHKYFFKNKPP